MDRKRYLFQLDVLFSLYFWPVIASQNCFVVAPNLKDPMVLKTTNSISLFCSTQARWIMRSCSSENTEQLNFMLCYCIVLLKGKNNCPSKRIKWHIPWYKYNKKDSNYLLPEWQQLYRLSHIPLWHFLGQTNVFTQIQKNFSSYKYNTSLRMDVSLG